MATPPANQRPNTFMTTETMLMVGSGGPLWATDTALWKDSFLQSTTDTVEHPWSTTSLRQVRTNTHLLTPTTTFQMDLCHERETVPHGTWALAVRRTWVSHYTTKALPQGIDTNDMSGTVPSSHTPALLSGNSTRNRRLIDPGRRMLNLMIFRKYAHSLLAPL